jgi:membrane-bound metal-dependent hydrolase YbcI (DUF457 family)
MTATNHVLTGATIALTIKQPVLAIPLSFLSHFVLDSLPHFGVPLQDVFANDKNRFVRIIIFMDTLLTIIAFIILTFFVRFHVANWVVFSCMAAAYAPDSVWLYRFISLYKSRILKPENWFTRFHSFIQWGERQWGIWVEAAWFIVASDLIIRLR